MNNLLIGESERNRGNANYVSANEWTQVGGSQGSNPGGLYRDERGVDWYVKTPDNPERARNEVLAGRLYKLCDVAVPELKLVVIGNKLSVASRFIPGLVTGRQALLSSDVSGVLRGFAIDAWLANWDVIGTDDSNIQIDGERNAVRIDLGGALRFRAQGAPKGAAFSDLPGELDSLRSSCYPSAHAVFGKITAEQIRDSSRPLIHVSIGAISDLVEEFGPVKREEREKLLHVLLKRKAVILTQSGWDQDALEKEQTRAWAYFNANTDKYSIRNELLYALLTYGDGRVLEEGLGNWNGNSTAVRAIVSWLVRRALGIDRFPWHADYALTSRPDEIEAVRRWFEKLQQPGALDEVCEELMNIYAHTQQVLRREKISHYKLCRSLDSKYAALLVNMQSAAAYLGLPGFVVSMDALTSWGTSSYSNYPVTIELTIPARNMLWGSKTIQSFGKGTDATAVEQGEWLVANRAIDGRFFIPVGAVTRKKIDEESVVHFKNPETACQFLRKHADFFLGEFSFYKTPDSSQELEVSKRLRLHRSLTHLKEAYRTLLDKRY